MIPVSPGKSLPKGSPVLPGHHSVDNKLIRKQAKERQIKHEGLAKHYARKPEYGQCNRVLPSGMVSITKAPANSWKIA